MISSLTTALEETRSENDALKSENTQLRTNNDNQEDEIGQLTTLLNKMVVTNENQIQQMKSMRDENKQLKTEVHMIKSENVQLKNEIDDLMGCVDRSNLQYPQTSPRMRQNLKVS